MYYLLHASAIRNPLASITTTTTAAAMLLSSMSSSMSMSDGMVFYRVTLYCIVLHCISIAHSQSH